MNLYPQFEIIYAWMGKTLKETKEDPSFYDKKYIEDT